MDTSEQKKDAELMPPPPVPAPTPQQPTAPVVPPKPEKVLNTPLAMMLPEKFKNAEVTDFFPAFRENQVLRFSQLFPIKESHKPRDEFFKCFEFCALKTLGD